MPDAATTIAMGCPRASAAIIVAPVSTRALCVTVAHKPIGLEAEQHKHKGNYAFIHFGLLLTGYKRRYVECILMFVLNEPLS